MFDGSLAWLALVATLAGLRWGVPGVLEMLAAAALAFFALPLAERVREDVQAIRGFLHRDDAALAPLLAESRRLLEAFPELAR